MSQSEGQRSVAVVGAGPIGLITAVGLARHGVPVVVFEKEHHLSSEARAGTILTRTLEVLHRYGAVDEVLRESLRIDEIGDIDRASNTQTFSVKLGELYEETRFPFVVNIPQYKLEPALRAVLDGCAPDALHMGHRLVGFTQYDDHVALNLATADGPKVVEASYLLGCDGGRSFVRDHLEVKVAGKTFTERYMLVDVVVDLDIENPRDYPYLTYFGDPVEWMILVRLPHCWRFVYPLAEGKPAPSPSELGAKARQFIGDVSRLEVIDSNIYAVHQRVAEHWRQGRVLLMGDAAHLITPMWALGLNTGVLDASNLVWRLAWLAREWADESLLAGYEAEQAPLAVHGSGQMAEAARAHMNRRPEGAAITTMTRGNWGNAVTRALLGVSLDVDGTGDWSMAKTGDSPTRPRTGDRAPDVRLFGQHGWVHLHDLAADAFVALYFIDARRRTHLPGEDSPAMRRFVASRWDAPHDSGLRERALFDPSDRARQRFGVPLNTLVLIRPDGHIAAIVPFDPNGAHDQAAALYTKITGRPPPDR